MNVFPRFLFPHSSMTARHSFEKKHVDGVQKGVVPYW